MKSTLCVLLSFVAIVVHGQTWQPVGPDDFNQASLGKSDYLNVTSDAGNVYVAYTDQMMGKVARVRKHNGTSWTYLGGNISQGEANYVAMALGTGNMPYVAFQDYWTNNKITVKKWDGTNWINVGSAGFSAGTASTIAMTMDGSGTPYVAYVDAANASKITVQKFNGTSWVVVGSAGFSAGTVFEISLTVDNSGNPYVAYGDFAVNGAVTVKKFDGVNWADISTGISSGTSCSWLNLKNDGTGQMYLSFSDYNHALYVEKWNGTAWTNLGIVPAAGAQLVQMEFDQQHVPYLAFSENSVTDIAVVKYISGTWTPVGSPILGSASRISLSISPAGTPNLAYEDYYTADKGRVMNYNGTSWTDVGTRGASAAAVFNIKLTADASGVPYVSYYTTADVLTLGVEVKKYNGSSWVSVGSLISGSGSSDIAIDNSGTPYVVCTPNTLSALQVKKYNGASWVDVGLPIQGDPVNNLPAIAIDANNVPYVAFRDNTNGKASVMKYNGSSWVYVGTPEFSASSIGLRIEMIIGQNNTPYVVYGDAANSGGVTVMKFDGTNWVSVGNPGVTGPMDYPSLAFDHNGVLYEVSSEVGYGAVVRKFDGTNWVLVGPQGISTAGTFNTTIAVDSLNRLYVAYTENVLGFHATVKRYDGANWSDFGNPDFSAGPGLNADMIVTHSDVIVAYSGHDLFAKKLNVNITGLADPFFATPDKLSIYPNPATDHIALSAKNVPAGVYTVSIYNLQGQLVSSQTIQHHGGGAITSLSLPEMTPGVYWVRLQGVSASAAGEFIKK